MEIIGLAMVAIEAWPNKPDKCLMDCDCKLGRLNFRLSEINKKAAYLRVECYDCGARFEIDTDGNIYKINLWKEADDKSA